MPIPNKFKEILAKKIIDSLNNNNLIVENQSPENLQLIIGDIINKGLSQDDYDNFNPSETNIPQGATTKNLAQLKEQLAEQKSIIRRAELEKTKIINEGQLRENNLVDFYKKKLEEEKVELTNKLKSFEETNKINAQESQNATDEDSKLKNIKEELQNIQELLAVEKELQKNLLEEKFKIEEDLKRTQAELNDSSNETENSSLIKDAISKIKNYKDENSKLQKQIAKLLAKFKKEIQNKPKETDKTLEKKIAQLQKEIKELQKTLSAVEAEKEELLALHEQNLQNQTEEKNLPQEITDELNIQSENSKNFKLINQLNEDSFNIFKTALNSKEEFENRIKKIDGFIKITKEKLEEITAENKNNDSPENYSMEVLEYFSEQIKKKEVIKKILIEQRQLNKEVEKEDQPIIIQKKVIKKHSAHGGSWKVAYADFVTAMMAFFLMLWLLSMLSQEARDNLKEYFKSYKAFKHSGQEISKGKDSIRTTDAVRISQESKKLDQKRMIEEFKNQFKGADEHLKVVEVPGGVRIQVMDVMDKPMFEIGSSKLKPEAKEIFEFLSERIKKLPGKIIIEGHTDGLKYSRKEKTNWELSMERASTARLELVNNGVDENRLSRIVAYGFSEPINQDDFFDPRNRRINIIIQNTDSLKKNENKQKNENTMKEKGNSH